MVNTSTLFMNKSFQLTTESQTVTQSKDILGNEKRKKLESYYVRVSLNEEHHMSPECTVSTKTLTVQLPFKVLRGKTGKLKVRDEDNRSLMHKYTKQFLEDCNRQFGLKPKLKHIFKQSGHGTARQPKYESAEFLIDGEREFVEIMDITEIVHENLDHVYVSMVPFVRSNVDRNKSISLRLKDPLSLDQSKILDLSTDQSMNVRPGQYLHGSSFEQTEGTMKDEMGDLNFINVSKDLIATQQDSEVSQTAHAVPQASAQLQQLLSKEIRINIKTSYDTQGHPARRRDSIEK